MIGLGKKYLTAAGFGRYRITAASLGNLDLLGTLSWLKAATKQAILGAFGDDGWAVIKATNAYLNGIAASDRDKATALAGFVNEDPMMVCSLGLEVQGVTMPIRWLVTDNKSWIDTGSSLDQGARLKAHIIIKGSNAHNVILGAHELSSPYKRNMVGFYNGTFWLGCGNSDLNGGTASINGEYVINGTTKRGAPNMVVDGTQVINGTDSGARSARNLYFLANNNTANGGSQFFNGHIAYGEVYDENETLLRNFVPCKHNNEAGWLDLVNVVWYANGASNGQFTIPDISYTPSTP